MKKDVSQNKLNTDSIGKLMLEMCTQTTFSILLYNIYTITDTFYVSREVGSLASASIGIFSPVLVLVGGISSTLGTGGSSIISRKLGAEDQEGSRQVVGCLIWIWLICAFFITSIGLLFLHPLLPLLGCTPEIEPYALQYGQIMLLGIIISTGFSGIMRAEGDIFFSTLQWSLPVITNIILDFLFLHVFHMGIAGAAWATFAAQLLSAVSSIYYFFFRKNTFCHITLREIHWNQHIGKEIFFIGFPSFLNNLANSFLVITWNHVLGQTGGNQAIGTFTVVSRIQSFLSTPFSGIMQGIQPMAGFYWVRRETAKLKKTLCYALSSSIFYGFLICVLCYWKTYDILSLFTEDTSILQMGKNALQILCMAFPVNGILPIVQAYWQAVGSGRKVLFLSFCSIFIIRLPLVLFSNINNNIITVWFSFIIGDYITAVFAVCQLKNTQKGIHIWKA